MSTTQTLAAGGDHNSLDGTSSTNRISAHTHIKGLGLTPDGTPIPNAAGLVGQVEAREAAGYIVDLIRSKKFAGKALLLAGAAGSGKTAIAMAIARELGNNIPFCPMVGSEVFSTEVKKTEVIMANFRRAIGLRIKEYKTVFEGEVTAITPVEGEQQVQGYGRTISHVLLGLKTQKVSKTLKLDPSIYTTLRKQNIRVGDVLYLESDTGIVKRAGRCDAHIAENDLSGDLYVPLPAGDIPKQLEVVQELTLHDLDVANAKPTSGSDLVSVIQGISAPRRTEITSRLRAEVNKVVSKYIQQGVCEVVPGVLFIDEVHMLDSDCHAFLNSALEQPISPVVIVATNRGVTNVRGTDIKSPHGIPTDLLDRMMIIRTYPYSATELYDILKIRVQVENLSIENDALFALADIGAQTSLRYILQLISPASTIANSMGSTIIKKEHILQTRELFLDAKSSARIISRGGFLG